MRLISLALLALLALAARAQEQPPVPHIDSETPKDVEAQEHYVLLSVKLKNLAEIQDLMLKQQQLIFQHLEALHKQVEQFEQDRTNLVSRAELDQWLAKLDQWHQQVECERETNRQIILKALKEIPVQTNQSKASAPTNFPGTSKFEQYRVQAGDTLSRIVLRWNDTLDKQGLPKVTQEQIERLNSGLAPDRIRSGQVILLPVPDAIPDPAGMPIAR